MTRGFVRRGRGAVREDVPTAQGLARRGGGAVREDVPTARHLGRPVASLTGLLVLALAWLGPLPALAREAFAAHMTLHMAVVAVAAPLLALGLAGGILDPVRRLPWLFAAVPASAVELAVVWSWHAPVLHHAARHDAGWMVVEQGTFLLSGLLVWLSAFGGGRALRAERTGAGVVGLLLTSMHMTLLGALLALSPRPLYQHAVGSAVGDALADQHLGGALMLGVGGAVYLAGGLWLVGRLLRDRAGDARAPGPVAGAMPDARGGV